jgi:hypothetical protein
MGDRPGRAGLSSAPSIFFCEALHRGKFSLIGTARQADCCGATAWSGCKEGSRACGRRETAGALRQDCAQASTKNREGEKKGGKASQEKGQVGTGRSGEPRAKAGCAAQGQKDRESPYQGSAECRTPPHGATPQGATPEEGKHEEGAARQGRADEGKSEKDINAASRGTEAVRSAQASRGAQAARSG